MIPTDTAAAQFLFVRIIDASDEIHEFKIPLKRIHDSLFLLVDQRVVFGNVWTDVDNINQK